MTLDRLLHWIGANLSGTCATDVGISFLRSRLPANLTPDWLMKLLSAHALAGTSFSLSEDHDKSGIGAEVLWLRPEQIVSECIECQPGKSVLSFGFLAIGACEFGSGDPYFLDLRSSSSDPPLVRVAHDYARAQPYPLERIEIVSSSLSDLFRHARY